MQQMTPSVIDADLEAVTNSGHCIIDSLLTVTKRSHDVIGTTHIDLHDTEFYNVLNFASYEIGCSNKIKVCSNFSSISLVAENIN
jgi:hypothetical protein